MFFVGFELKIWKNMASNMQKFKVINKFQCAKYLIKVILSLTQNQFRTFSYIFKNYLNAY